VHFICSDEGRKFRSRKELSAYVKTHSLGIDIRSFDFIFVQRSSSLSSSECAVSTTISGTCLSRLSEPAVVVTKNGSRSVAGKLAARIHDVRRLKPRLTSCKNAMNRKYFSVSATRKAGDKLNDSVTPEPLLFRHDQSLQNGSKKLLTEQCEQATAVQNVEFCVLPQSCLPVQESSGLTSGKSHKCDVGGVPDMVEQRLSDDAAVKEASLSNRVVSSVGEVGTESGVSNPTVTTTNESGPSLARKLSSRIRDAGTGVKKRRKQAVVDQRLTPCFHAVQGTQHNKCSTCNTAALQWGGEDRGAIPTKFGLFEICQKIFWSQNFCRSFLSKSAKFGTATPVLVKFRHRNEILSTGVGSLQMSVRNLSEICSYVILGKFRVKTKF